MYGVSYSIPNRLFGQVNRRREGRLSVSTNSHQVTSQKHCRQPTSKELHFGQPMCCRAFCSGVIWCAALASVAVACQVQCPYCNGGRPAIKGRDAVDDVSATAAGFNQSLASTAIFQKLRSECVGPPPFAFVRRTICYAPAENAFG